MPLSHLIGSVTTARDGKALMYGALVVSGTTVALTYLLTVVPGLRLYGVIASQAAGQILMILWDVGILALWRRERHR